MDEQGIKQLAAESVALKQRFFEANAGLLVAAGRRMAECLRGGGKVLAFGNGGSAADAQHLAGELVGRFLRDRPALSALALSSDPSVVSAIANDMGYESVFRRQVEAHGRRGDVALGITTSARSASVVQGLHAARERGLVIVALTGGSGGLLSGLVDFLVAVTAEQTPRVV